MPDAPEKLSPPALPQRLCSRLEGWLAYFFMLFWLIPILFVGLTNKSLPNSILTGIGVPYKVSKEVLNFTNNMYRVACLFPKRVGKWGNYYYLVRLEGAKDWISVPEYELTRLKPFGYRSRLKRMLDGGRRDQNVDVRRQAMAAYIKRRYEQRHPDVPRVVAVRFVRAVYLTGSDVIAKPDGHWQRPPLNSVPENQVWLISTHTFENGEGS